MTQQEVHTRLFLLRHGEVEWTLAAGADPPLSAAGLAAAELAASTLPRFDHIATSPQRPALETAEAIGAVRGITPWWHEDLDEIRTVTPPAGAAAYDAWLDQLFESLESAVGGESVADGAARMSAALRRTADRFHGRRILVVSHPVILLAFRATQIHTTCTREQVRAMPELAMATVEYVEGRFYLVQDFPVHWAVPRG